MSQNDRYLNLALRRGECAHCSALVGESNLGKSPFCSTSCQLLYETSSTLGMSTTTARVGLANGGGETSHAKRFLKCFTPAEYAAKNKKPLHGISESKKSLERKSESVRDGCIRIGEAITERLRFTGKAFVDIGNAVGKLSDSRNDSQSLQWAETLLLDQALRVSKLAHNMSFVTEDESYRECIPKLKPKLESLLERLQEMKREYVRFSTREKTESAGTQQLRAKKYYDQTRGWCDDFAREVTDILDPYVY